MEKDILDGISALLIALLILSMITEKTTLIIRSYPRQFVVIGIGCCLSLIWALWFNSDFVDTWGLPAILLNLIVFSVFYIFLAVNHNKFHFLYEGLTNGHKNHVHYVNLIFSIIFHAFTLLWMDFTFSIWNLLVFGLLFLFIQSLLYRDLLTAITKGKATGTNQKETEITLLSMVIGGVIAFMFHASFFDLLKEGLNPEADFSRFFTWKGGFPIKFNGVFIEISTKFKLLPKDFIGIAITGAFLSFGSKFFHDTLSYILEIKNLKKKLNNGETYNIDVMPDLDEHLQTAESAMTRTVSEQFSSSLKLDHPNIRSINPGLSMINGKKRNSIIIHLKDHNSANIPKLLPYRLSSGRVIDLPVEIVEAVDMPIAQNRPGSTLVNIDDIDKTGTFGCLVEHDSGQEYILTCSHVALEGSSTDKGGVINESLSYMILGHGHPFIVADELFYARRDAENDTALLKPFRTDISNSNLGVTIRGERLIDPEKDRLVNVHFFGSASGHRTGQIHQPKFLEEEKFRYGDRQIITFRNLIVFGQKRGDKWKTISRQGDSGAIVFDDNHTAIGILIGGNKQFSYALPIKPILTQAKCTIKI